jgi:hypothetical protein
MGKAAGLATQDFGRKDNIRIDDSDFVGPSELAVSETGKLYSLVSHSRQNY